MLTKTAIIKKLPGEKKYRLYSRKKDSKGKRKNLGTFDSLSAAKKHEGEVQFFKSHSDDGLADDHETKILDRLSNAAIYLEEAGFIPHSKKVYAIMSCIDPSLADDTDCIIDPCINSDQQLNLGGPVGTDGSIQNTPSFGMDVATLVGFNILPALVKLAGELDQKGLYEDADEIDDLIADLADDMPRIIEKLEKAKENKKLNETKTPTKPKQSEEAFARSNGLGGSSATDSPGCGGLSDTYFYRGSGSIESNL